MAYAGINNQRLSSWSMNGKIIECKEENGLPKPVYKKGCPYQS